MNQPTIPVTVEPLSAYSSADAIALGELLTHLSDSFSGEPVPESTLEDIIQSPLHEQFVARDSSGRIIGAATVSVIMGAGAARNAWLEDFVVHPDARGTGAADAIWQALMDWCKQHRAKSLNFTSKPSRKAAHRFYEKHGASVRDTSCFKKVIG